MIYVVLLAALVFIMDIRQTRWNARNSIGNGPRSVPLILAGQAYLPSQHRVWVAWLSGCESGYQITKGIGVLFAFWMMYYYYQVVDAPMVLCLSLTALFLVIAQTFDYADVYWEVGFFAASFSLLTKQPELWPLLLGLLVFFATLNRETAIFIPIAVILSGFFWGAILPILGFGLGYMIPRWKYGNGAGKYLNPGNNKPVSFWMVGENFGRIGAARMSDFWFSINPYGHFFVLVAFMIWATFMATTGIHFTALLMFICLLVPTIWAEIRVFAVPVMVMIPVLVGG